MSEDLEQSKNEGEDFVAPETETEQKEPIERLREMTKEEYVQMEYEISSKIGHAIREYGAEIIESGRKHAAGRPDIELFQENYKLTKKCVDQFANFEPMNDEQRRHYEGTGSYGFGPRVSNKGKVLKDNFPNTPDYYFSVMNNDIHDPKEPLSVHSPMVYFTVRNWIKENALNSEDLSKLEVAETVSEIWNAVMKYDDAKELLQEYKIDPENPKVYKEV